MHTSKCTPATSSGGTAPSSRSLCPSASFISTGRWIASTTHHWQRSPYIGIKINKNHFTPRELTTATAIRYQAWLLRDVVRCSSAAPRALFASTPRIRDARMPPHRRVAMQDEPPHNCLSAAQVGLGPSFNHLPSSRSLPSLRTGPLDCKNQTQQQLGVCTRHQ